MLLEIDKFEQFKIFFDVVYDITEFIELQLFEDYMTCSILDKAHTRFMSANFSKDFFASYEIDDVESVTLFSEDLHKIIKSASKIDNVVLMTNENYLICKLESGNGNSRIFEFVLPSEFIESPHPPSIPFPIKLTLDIGVLKQGVKDLKTLDSGEVQFNVVNGNFSITSGNEIHANYSSNVAVDGTFDMDSVSRYSLEYIEQLLKFEKLSKMVDLKMGTDFPLVYSFKNNGVEIMGLIAPRIEVED